MTPREPARNRVTPTGDIVAIPLRGAWTGNRGRLHEGRELVRFHSGALWIICTPQFRGRWNEQWQPHHYTFLFFHDEAVAFAAGHRPCAQCRWASYQSYRNAWAAELGGAAPSAGELNRRLHGERLVRGSHRRRLHQVGYAGLPDGSFVAGDDGPALVLGDALVTWTTSGYAGRRRRPRAGTADILTPPATLAVLRAGYPVQIDATARR